MRTILFFLLSMFAALAAMGQGFAPESLGGTIYRDWKQSSSGIEYLMVHLRADGTYAVLRLRSGRTVWFYSESLDEGTFQFAKTGESTANLTLFPGGAASGAEFSLVFTSDESGTVEVSRPYGFFDGSFRIAPFPSEGTLLNLSCRITVGPETPGVAGFVVSGQQKRTILVRVVGPALQSFGVQNPLPDPEYVVFRGATPWGYAWDWGDQHPSAGPPRQSMIRMFEACGAFPLEDFSKDAAQVFDLEPGAYTVHARSSTADVGEVLIEVYMLP